MAAGCSQTHLFFSLLFKFASRSTVKIQFIMLALLTLFVSIECSTCEVAMKNPLVIFDSCQNVFCYHRRGVSGERKKKEKCFYDVKNLIKIWSVKVTSMYAVHAVHEGSFSGKRRQEIFHYYMSFYLVFNPPLLPWAL